MGGDLLRDPVRGDARMPAAETSSATEAASTVQLASTATKNALPRPTAQPPSSTCPGTSATGPCQATRRRGRRTGGSWPGWRGPGGWAPCRCRGPGRWRWSPTSDGDRGAASAGRRRQRSAGRAGCWQWDRPSPAGPGSAGSVQSTEPLRGGRAGEKMGVGLPADAVSSLAFEAAVQPGAGAPFEGSRTVATSTPVSRRSPGRSPLVDPQVQELTDGDLGRCRRRGERHLGRHCVGVPTAARTVLLTWMGRPRSSRPRKARTSHTPGLHSGIAVTAPPCVL